MYDFRGLSADCIATGRGWNLAHFSAHLLEGGTVPPVKTKARSQRSFSVTATGAQHGVRNYVRIEEKREGMEKMADLGRKPRSAVVAEARPEPAARPLIAGARLESERF